MSRTLCMLGVASMVLCGLASVAGAYPTYSTASNCGNCHSSSVDGSIVPYHADSNAVFGGTNYAVFQATPGVSKALQYQITSAGLNSGDLYAVSFLGFDSNGTSGRKLVFSYADVAGQWTDKKAAAPDWWYTPSPYLTFSGSAQNGDFILKVDPNTPAGYYPVEFMMGGQTGQVWGAAPFYVQVVPEPVTLGLLGAGALMLIVRKRRSRRV
jgi:hypothetical protein